MLFFFVFFFALTVRTPLRETLLQALFLQLAYYVLPRLIFSSPHWTFYGFRVYALFLCDYLPFLRRLWFPFCNLGKSCYLSNKSSRNELFLTLKLYTSPGSPIPSSPTSAIFRSPKTRGREPVERKEGVPPPLQRHSATGRVDPLLGDSSPKRLLPPSLLSLFVLLFCC